MDRQLRVDEPPDVSAAGGDLKNPIIPRCKANYPQYISAEGQWFPCCFASQRYQDWTKDWFYINREHFDLRRHRLDEILRGKKLKELEGLWSENGGAQAPYWCQVQCRSKSKSFTVVEEEDWKPLAANGSEEKEFFADGMRLFFEGRMWSAEDLRQEQVRFTRLLQARRSRKPLVIWRGGNHPKALALLAACATQNLWLASEPEVDAGFREILTARLFFDQNEQMHEQLGSDDIEGSGLVLFSSGTTGRPKGTRLPWTMLDANASQASQMLRLSQYDRVVVSSSFASTAGWNTLLIPALRAGLEIHLTRGFNVFEILNSMKKLRRSVYHFSPLQARLLSEARGWQELTPGALHRCVLGSADVPGSLVKKFLDRGFSVVRNYGLTEAGPYVFSRISEPTDEHECLDDLGELGAGFEADYRPVADCPGTECLFLRGKAMFSGYVGESWREAGEWFETGDLIRRSGERIHYLCRKNDIIKKDGRVLFPNEIERGLMDRHLELRECWLRRKPGLAGFELLVDQRSATKINMSQLEQETRQQLRLDEKSDLSVTVVRRLPRTGSGKIRRV